jgi:MoaA/NifB/PqqE/SkfB family radical SAM enzyme
MKLNTGFPEITDERLNYVGIDPWYLELCLTGKCNFNCSYCNRFYSELDIDIFNKWISSIYKLHHIQITGGEPTIYPYFNNIISICREHTIKLGLSTNGSYELNEYLKLPIDMFSISLDDYDIKILEKRGYKNPLNIFYNIYEIAKQKYVNIGLVIDNINVNRIEDIIDFILSLGVNDIKLSISTKNEVMPVFTKTYDKYPILNYRVSNFIKNKMMRGHPTKKCYLVKNDISIVGNKHYPCLVYFREGGDAIGELNNSVFEDRKIWSDNHNSLLDPICSKYCMDFKCDFNKAKKEVTFEL